MAAATTSTKTFIESAYRSSNRSSIPLSVRDPSADVHVTVPWFSGETFTVALFRRTAVTAPPAIAAS
jgi:hypothetical protein